MDYLGKVLVWVRFGLRGFGSQFGFGYCVLIEEGSAPYRINDKAFQFIEWQIENAKAMYRRTYKRYFNFEHCWLMLRNQPKWSMPKEKSRIVLPPTLDSIPIADGDDVSLLDDTTTFKRPIGRKAEKANQKKKVSEKDVVEYLAKKMKCIEESQEPEKESLRIEVERVRLE
ncbi:uncharacterized protein LOC115952574 isoform X2 [Quercus lobata]|uniref:uncharacterized protein LOC115952574 isoform X2 n=1 Tax=Quercus lobata TaxID=97700 RepID=UPI001248EF35|nr:uncharacterized protein LOC115952574 isoform X2 [Quercus lobata]